MKVSRPKIFLWITSFQIIGAFLGYLTQTNIYPWYNDLVKSKLTPPAVVFSITWPILYVLLAISGYMLWEARKNHKVKPALDCFIVQILMNWAWSPIFFYLHWIRLSFFWILAIAALTLITILLARNTLKTVSLLMLPYFMWLTFATYLNGCIWLLNS